MPKRFASVRAGAAALFWLLRLNRTIMVAVITGVGAYAAGAASGEGLPEVQ